MSQTGLELLRRLSRQPGTTEVWEARRADGTRLAVKRLTDTGLDREDARIRFDAEAGLLQRLGGRHGLVGCRDVHTDPPALVLEFAEGGSLGDRLERGPLPLRIVAVLGRQVAEALAWLHANDVIHRDVKPSNILMMGDGAFRLTDLGVAAFGNPPRGLPEGWIEEETGTTAYAAPELLRDAGHAAPAVDIYGLGAVLHEAVSGQLPHPMGADEDDDGYRRRLASGLAAGRVSEVVAAVDAPAAGDPRLPLLDRILLRALDPNPAARYSTAAELAAALSALG